jgi:hypothetical protein
MNRKKRFRIIKLIFSICGGIIGIFVALTASFSAQNTNIAILLITSLIGAIIGFAITWLFATLTYWRFNIPN